MFRHIKRHVNEKNYQRRFLVANEGFFDWRKDSPNSSIVEHKTKILKDIDDIARKCTVQFTKRKQALEIYTQNILQKNKDLQKQMQGKPFNVSKFRSLKVEDIVHVDEEEYEEDPYVLLFPILSDAMLNLSGLHVYARHIFQESGLDYDDDQEFERLTKSKAFSIYKRFELLPVVYADLHTDRNDNALFFTDFIVKGGYQPNYTDWFIASTPKTIHDITSLLSLVGELNTEIEKAKHLTTQYTGSNIKALNSPLNDLHAKWNLVDGILMHCDYGLKAGYIIAAGIVRHCYE